MKKQSIISNIQKATLLFLGTVIFFALPAISVAFQPELSEAYHHKGFDHVINSQGESRVSLLTGIPFVGTAEYAYGVSDRLTFGILGGFTPFEEAVGIRVRTVVYQKKESYRVYYCTPVVFYPQTNMPDAEPWWLIRPNINFEWLANTGLRYKFGGSLIGVASHRRIFGKPLNEKLTPELWSAVHAGVSMPVASQLSFQAEFSYITKGLRTVDTFFGGPPVLAILGFSYTF